MHIHITIVADQEAFLVDAPTPQASPRRWIQVKPESTDGFVGSAFGAGGRWAGACVRAGAFWGVQDWSAGLVRLVAGGVRLRCAGR